MSKELPTVTLFHLVYAVCVEVGGQSLGLLSPFSMEVLESLLSWLEAWQQEPLSIEPTCWHITSTLASASQVLRLQACATMPSMNLPPTHAGRLLSQLGLL